MTEPAAALSPNSIQERSIYDRTFWLAYIANTLLVLANALTFRFAELIEFLGGNERNTGDIVAVGLAASVLVRLSVSHVVDDYGTRKLWIFTNVLMLSGCGLFLFCTQLSWMIYIARIAYFVGLTGMYACSMTHIQNQVPPHRRTEVIGNLGSSGFIGLILGSNLSDVIIHSVPVGQLQFQVLFGGTTLVGVLYLVIVLVMTHGQKHVRHAPSSPAYRLLFRHWPGMVVVAAMVMGLGVVVTTVFLTRFATDRKIDGIGVFFTGYAISAFVFRILASRWSRTIGRHWMLIYGLAGQTIGHLLLAYVTRGWEFVIPSIICGFGHAVLFPAVVSLGAGAFPHEARGTGTAIILAFVDFGQLVFSPLLGRIIVAYGAHGFPAMFFTSSAIALIVAILYLTIAVRYADAEAEMPPEALVSADLE